ncbi:MAG TPA: hypothetical protein VJT49_12265 [Amycolatopsis sp.]|uniref:hypothetical protein n=1 Tax=Amycolatopsis sp. TaxID=37632 RepID=UPI002B473CD5|nr:hypothetical protein [Amycolatopsis sp.]HKS45861.1 hypothetical protein [Amycolatopsis sp.]
MNAPTRFPWGFRGNQPARAFRGLTSQIPGGGKPPGPHRYPIPNRPLHYPAPTGTPGGKPAGVPGTVTHYMPAAGSLAPPQPPQPPLPAPVPAEPPPPPRPGHGFGKPAFLTDPFFGPGLAAVAVILWVVGLSPISPAQIGGAGLIAELSVATLLSYPALIAAVMFELLRYKPRNWLLSLYTAIGVIMVYGLQPAVEEEARLPTSWLHAGFAEYIADHGEVLQHFDARFSWAGFFSLVAMITKAAGLPSAVPLLNWAPVVLEGLMVLGVRAFAVSALGNRRASWLAPWVFLCGNWTEQDYFSPQATTMVLSLAALTLTFRHLVRPRLTEPVRARLRARLAPRSSPKARLVAQGAVVLIGLGLAPTHQLTPFVLGGLLLVLLLFGRLWPAWLPFVMVGAAVVWFSLGAEDFWSGQLIQLILGPLGDVGSNVGQGLFSRFSGSFGHLVVLMVRVATTGFVIALAAAGIYLMRRRDGLRSWLLPALCAAPFGLALAQSYGGEVFMRCYLFALPIMALPSGIALERATMSARRLRLKNRPAHTLAVAAIPWLVLTVLTAATITARGGNDAYTTASSSDVAAVTWAVERARPGERVDSLVNAVPVDFMRVGEVEQSMVDVYCAQVDNLSLVVDCVRDKGPDYLVLTGPQLAYLRILDGVPAGYGDELLKRLGATGTYRLVYNNSGSLVLQRSTPALKDVKPVDGDTG